MDVYIIRHCIIYYQVPSQSSQSDSLYLCPDPGIYPDEDPDPLDPLEPDPPDPLELELLDPLDEL